MTTHSSWRLGGSILFAALFSFTPSALSPSVFAASQERTGAAANAICPGYTAKVTLPLRPGSESSMEWRVLADCSIVQSTLSVAPLNSPSNFTLTMHQESWDCCNIRMNGLYTTLKWTAAYGAAYKLNQYNTTMYHTEFPPYRGWWLAKQTLAYTGGCSGCSSLTLSGHAEYGYQGMFDPTGTLFYNTSSNVVTGQGDGSGGTCTYTFSWRHSAPGWNLKHWCQEGT